MIQTNDPLIPPLATLYQQWLAHRTGQVAAFIQRHQQTNGGQPPTPAQVAAEIEPPLISEGAAAYFLEAATCSTR